jgi:recombination protein RecR
MYVSPTRSATLAEPVAHLVEELGKLPGIGPKTAQRLAYFILRQPADDARLLANAILQVKEKIVYCSECWNLTECDPCSICTSAARDRLQVCVVEQPLDILALERTQSYHGLYHVLHGVISPMDGIGPGELKIEQLVSRVVTGAVQEVIVATNPSMEGDATAMYITRRLEALPHRVSVTRPARGLPMGGDLEFADEHTLKQALEGRREFR